MRKTAEREVEKGSMGTDGRRERRVREDESRRGRKVGRNKGGSAEGVMLKGRRKEGREEEEEVEGRG